MEVAKRGVVALTVCSTAFTALGRAQQKALGAPDLPIAVVPHPFGTRSRDELRTMAEQCVGEVARLLCEKPAAASAAHTATTKARLVEAPDDLETLNAFFMERRWGDGLLLVPPTEARVEHVLAGTRRGRHELIATVAPRYGAATVEHIAINAVMAGCKPEYLPLLISAVQAVTAKPFHLQAIQATTNPAAVALMVNGPLAQTLAINSGGNCFGPGAWANGTIGRALRLILQNIGGGLPGDMDKATHGQPAKWAFCFAENEAASPWEPLHVERGYAPGASTVTAVGPLGTWSMNITEKNPQNIAAMIGDTMQYPASSDYIHGGAPWVVLSPQHAELMARAGWSKADVKRQLWEASKMRAGRSRGAEFERMRNARSAELGDIGEDTLVPVTVQPDDITVVVAGGTGTHSVFMPVSAHTRSTTIAIES